LKAPPERIIGEILGEPASRQRNPVNAGYLCPFINSECMKRSHRLEGPYPVCSVWHPVKAPRLITTCPKRFYGTDLVDDVVANCWPGTPPTDLRVVHDVHMDRFGAVDLVMADLDTQTGQIREFVSVEIQAVDLTGSVEPAYSALLNSQSSAEATFGVNWANVRKRYMEQLVVKGFYHHQWGTRVVAVMQTPLYNRLREHVRFDEFSADDAVDVVFLLYDYVEASNLHEDHALAFDRAVGTSHISLMTHTLYQNPPPRKAFTDRIHERLA